VCSYVLHRWGNFDMKLLAAFTALVFSFPNLPASQQVSPVASSSTQATTLLARSLTTLTGQAALTDVTLSGTARRIAGSDDDTGTAVFKALASGAGRTDLSLSSGQRTEVCDLSATTPTGTWSGPDRTAHPIALHNLLSEPAWFFPAFAIARRLSATGYIATYVGHETRNGQAVEHISVTQSFSALPSPGSTLSQHLTQVDFFLDSTTLLPSAISFNTHPDDNALLDIPVEVQFSDYRAANGTQIPYHIQKFLNNSLLLDFQLQTVTQNSGLTSSALSVQ
jgi:hypothetical protein